MSLLVLIPLSIGMGLIGLIAFVWALRHDQFDDPDGNAHRVLMRESRDTPIPRTPGPRTGPASITNDDDGSSAPDRSGPAT